MQEPRRNISFIACSLAVDGFVINASVCVDCVSTIFTFAEHRDLGNMSQVAIVLHANAVLEGRYSYVTLSYPILMLSSNAYMLDSARRALEKTFDNSSSWSGVGRC